jgi:alkylation response protein AidB-like acyl-CoA dehydrogenase
MDLDFSEEQEMLRQTVRGVCERHAPIASVRALEDDAVGYSKELWRQLADLGLLGLTLPESYGGSALTAIEAAVVYEELGRALAPSPHFVSSVLSAGVLMLAGSDAQKSEWLPKIAKGEAILTPAWLEPDRGYGAVGIQAKAEPDGNGFKLSGVKRHVHFASTATRLLVLARTGKGGSDVDIFLVEPEARGVKLTQQMSLASDTQYKVELTNVSVPASARIGAAGSGWRTWNEVMHDGIILVAAQAIGGAERALEMTVQYAKEREQFDKPIGAFQAISHYLADGVTVISGGKTLVYEAAWARASARSVSKLAPMAKLFACQTYRDVTAMCEQVYGGYGFTVDFDIQLYFRRAKQLQLSWWDTRYLEELVAAATLDGKAA